MGRRATAFITLFVCKRFAIGGLGFSMCLEFCERPGVSLNWACSVARTVPIVG